LIDRSSRLSSASQTQNIKTVKFKKNKTHGNAEKQCSCEFVMSVTRLLNLVSIQSQYATSHINFGHDCADLSLGLEFLDNFTSRKKLRYWVILRCFGEIWSVSEVISDSLMLT